MEVYFRVNTKFNKDIRKIKWYKRRTTYDNENLIKILELLAIKYNYITYNVNKHTIHSKKFRKKLIGDIKRYFKIKISDREIRNLTRITNGKKVLISKNIGIIIMYIFNLLKDNIENDYTINQVYEYVRFKKLVEKEYHEFILDLFYDALLSHVDEIGYPTDSEQKNILELILKHIAKIRNTFLTNNFHDILSRIEEYDFFDINLL